MAARSIPQNVSTPSHVYGDRGRDAAIADGGSGIAIRVGVHAADYCNGWRNGSYVRSAWLAPRGAVVQTAAKLAVLQFERAARGGDGSRPDAVPTLTLRLEAVLAAEDILGARRNEALTADEVRAAAAEALDLLIVRGGGDRKRSHAGPTTAGKYRENAARRAAAADAAARIAKRSSPAKRGAAA